MCWLLLLLHCAITVVHAGLNADRSQIAFKQGDEVKVGGTKAYVLWAPSAANQASNKVWVDIKGDGKGAVETAANIWSCNNDDNAACGDTYLQKLVDANKPKEALWNKVANRFATSYTECHETINTGFNNQFEDCHPECTGCAEKCTGENREKWGCHGTRTAECTETGSDGSACAFCGTGVCCRMGRDSDTGDCDSVKIKGTRGHHGCVPRSISEVCERRLPPDHEFYDTATTDTNKNTPRYKTVDALFQKVEACPKSKGYNKDTAKCESCIAGSTYSDTDNYQTCKPCSTECKNSELGTQSVRLQCTTDQDVDTQCVLCNHEILKRAESFYRDTPGLDCIACSTQQQTCDEWKAVIAVPELGPSDSSGYQNCQNAEAGECICGPGLQPKFPALSSTNPFSALSSTNPCEVCTDGKYSDTYGLNPCVPCGIDMKSNLPRNSSANCNCDTKPNHVQVAPFERRCVSCSIFTAGHKPYRPVNQTDCSNCPVGFWLDLSTDAEANCTQIPRIELECPKGNVFGWILNPSTDQYAPNNRFGQQQSLFIRDVPSGSYLDISTHQIQSCDYCPIYQYADLCGPPYSESVYLQAGTTIFKQALDDDSPLPCIKPADYSLVRQGICLECEACGINTYNDGCGSKDQPKGTCKECAKHCLESNQFLNHTLSTGCDHPHATEDYQCADCEVIHKSRLGRYYIVVACAHSTYHRWKEGNGDFSTITCSPPPWSADSECDSERDWKSAGTYLPYCPPEYYVDQACADASMSAWKKECCLKCTNPNTAELKKPFEWTRCSGADTTDTQRMVARCENNYYQDGDSCKRCETCSTAFAT